MFAVILCSGFTIFYHYYLLMKPVFWPPTRVQFLFSPPHNEEHRFVCCYVLSSPPALKKGSRKGFLLLAQLLGVETLREREVLMPQTATLLTSIPLVPAPNPLPHLLERAMEVLQSHVSHKK